MTGQEWTRWGDGCVCGGGKRPTSSITLDSWGLERHGRDKPQLKPGFGRREPSFSLATDRFPSWSKVSRNYFRKFKLFDKNKFVVLQSTTSQIKSHQITKSLMSLLIHATNASLAHQLTVSHTSGPVMWITQSVQLPCCTSAEKPSWASLHLLNAAFFKLLSIFLYQRLRQACIQSTGSRTGNIATLRFF